MDQSASRPLTAPSPIDGQRAETDGSLTPSQIAAIGRLPIGKGAPIAPFKSEIPSRIYTDPRCFDEEAATLFPSVPLLAGHSSLLPEPQSFATLDLIGTPVLLTRARDGIARAFLNVCRHRGTILCPNASGAGPRLSCPYHAWTYDLHGQLSGVPQAAIFEGLDKAAHGLIELPCREAGGLIWVGINPDAAIDFAPVEGALADEMNAIRLGSMRLFGHATYHVKANWKLVMDTMLDGYHVTRLHKDTLARFFFDTPAVVTEIDRHIRSVSARANFEGAAGITTFDAARQVTVASYTLFPMGIIVVSPAYVNLCVVKPEATGSTTVEYYMLTDADNGDARAQDLLERSFALMDRAFGKEDFWAAEMGQKGLEKGRLPQLLLGGMETQMAQFHANIAAALETPHPKALP